MAIRDLLSANDEPVFREEDLLCAVAAKAEGATWGQIREMFPVQSPGLFNKRMGEFCFKWMPEWSPNFSAFDSASLRAVVKNYTQKNDPNYVAPEWMTN